MTTKYATTAIVVLALLLASALLWRNAGRYVLVPAQIESTLDITPEATKAAAEAAAAGLAPPAAEHQLFKIDTATGKTRRYQRMIDHDGKFTQGWYEVKTP